MELRFWDISMHGDQFTEIIHGEQPEKKSDKTCFYKISLQAASLHDFYAHKNHVRINIGRIKK
jgi:hypothetical protein